MLNKIIRPLVVGLLTVGLLTGCPGPQNIPAPQGSTGLCADQTYRGFPNQEPAMSGTFFVCHQGFALVYSTRLHTPLWVVENLKAENLKEIKATRENEKFRSDGFLPKGITPEPEKYSRTGFDRGHMAPAADFVGSPAAMSRSFYTSNIVPQNPDNNRGIWAKLEKNVRAWAKQKGEVYVITGPIFYANGKPYNPMGWISLIDQKVDYVIKEYNDDELVDPVTGVKNKQRKKKEVLKSGIAIPTHLYKIVYDPKTNQGIAFVIPNQPLAPNSLAQYATTIAEVERLTYIRFFPDMDMEQQGKVKTNVDPKLWLLGI